MRWFRRASVLALACASVASPAAAQSASPAPDAPAYSAPISFGAEVSAVAGPSDSLAFFNYTDYKHNTLRMSVVRLFGEWRASAQLSFLTEVRGEDLAEAEVASLYARWHPLAHQPLDVQAGRIPPVIGAFARRAYGRDNPLISVPLGYQYLTSLRPDALPASVDDLLLMRSRGWESSFPIGSATPAPGVPLVSGLHWDTGVEARWRPGSLDVSGAWTRGAPSQPVVRDNNAGDMWSGRIAVHVPAGLTLGASAARGEWTATSAVDLLAAGTRGHTHQQLVGADAEFVRGGWLVRGEVLHTVFEMPSLAATTASRLGATTAFAEARWRFLPRWDIAVRADTLGFSRVQGTLFQGAPTPWDAPVHRIDAVLGLRAFRDVEIRAGWQQNWRDAGRVTHQGVPALQVLWWY